MKRKPKADSVPEKQTNLTVSPCDVRLSTKGTAYTWIYTPQSKHLFSKNLSSHSLEGYKELYSGVGRTFYATLTDPNYHRTESDRVTSEEGGVSSNPRRLSWTELETKLVNLESRFATLEADFGLCNAWKFTFLGTLVLVTLLTLTLCYYIYWIPKCHLASHALTFGYCILKTSQAATGSARKTVMSASLSFFRYIISTMMNT